MPDYDKRMKEFVWYHLNGDGDCNGQVLRVYAQTHKLTLQDVLDLTYFYATTYCCASAIFMMQNRERIIMNYEDFADEYKKKLIFQSDRKYVRMLDNFKGMLATWVFQLSKGGERFHDIYTNNGIVDTKKVLSHAEKWFFFSRFSAYLFMETYCDIMNYGATHASGLDYEGDSMTFAGGLFYCFGMDDEALYVQKYHKLPIDRDTFESLIQEVQHEVRKAGGDDNFTKLETSLCAYEKFFKGTRYNGYYADRQLEEVVKMREIPEFAAACDEVLGARKKAIQHCYRGEDNGWYGIRREEKKSYRENSRISYCPY
jgi:hypothetical protein